MRFFWVKNYLRDKKSLVGFCDGENKMHTVVDIVSSREDFRQAYLTGVIDSVDVSLEGDNIGVELLLNDKELSEDNGFYYIETNPSIKTDDYSELEAQLLTSWLDASKGEAVINQFAISHKLTGSPEAVGRVIQLLNSSSLNMLVTKELDGRVLVLGGQAPNKDGTKMFGAYSILTNAETYTLLCTMLKSPSANAVPRLTGAYYLSDSGNPYAYAVMPKIDMMTDMVYIDFAACPKGTLYSMIASEEVTLRQGLNVNDNLYSTKSVFFAQFADSVGDVIAVSYMDKLRKTRLFVVRENQIAYLYAACINGVYVSLKDILALQTTFEHLENALGSKIAGMFSKGNQGPVCRLMIRTDKVSDNVVILDASQLHGPLARDLELAYAYSCTEGLNTLEITDAITGPVVSGYALSTVSIKQGDQEAITEYNKLLDRLYPITPLIKQRKATDTLSRALPTYEQLKEVYQVTNVDDAVDDALADTEAAETNYFSESVESSNVMPTYHNFDDFDMHIDLEYMPVNSIFEYYDCVHLREAIRITNSSVDPQLIEGNYTNNTLGIRDNELVFYLALRNLILRGICVENNIYTKQDLENALVAGVTSTVVDAFLRDIASDAYALNWAHTGHVTRSLGAAQLSDDEDESASDEALVEFPGRYYVDRESIGGEVAYKRVPDISFFREPGQVFSGRADEGTTVTTIVTDGWNRICGYMQNSVLNSFGWLEAAIRLMRWGAVKPTALYVPSTTRRMFLDMQSLNISDFSGSFEIMTPTTYKDRDRDVSYSLFSTITTGVHNVNVSGMNEHFGTSLQEGRVYPSGMILATTYVNSTEVQYTYIDVFTLASLVADASIDILGVYYDEGTASFTCMTEGREIQQTSITDTKEQDTFIYLPEEAFSMDREYSYDLAAINNLAAKIPHNVTTYTCKFLLKPLSLMEQMFKSVADKHTITAFELSRFLNNRIDWQFLEDCKAIEGILNNQTELDAYKKELMKFRSMSEKDILEHIVFSETVLPLYSKFFDTLDGSETLGEMLTKALAALRDFDLGGSSATRTTAPISFEQAVRNCSAYYRYVNPLTNEVLFYGAMPNIPNKVLLWSIKDAETYNLSSLQVEYRDVSIVELWNKYVAKLKPIWEVALSKTRSTPASMKELTTEVTRFFILPSLNTYKDAITTCVKAIRSMKNS